MITMAPIPIIGFSLGATNGPILGGGGGSVGGKVAPMVPMVQGRFWGARTSGLMATEHRSEYPAEEPDAARQGGSGSVS